MTYYVEFNPASPDPHPIIGLYDTTANYAEMPPPSNLLELTAQQWATVDHTMGVSNGNLVALPPPPPPPPPTLSQQASAMLAEGIKVTSASNPSLNGTYPCTQESNNQDGNTLAAVNAGLTFPNNVIIRLDTSGQPHAFSIDEFKAYCQAKITYQQELQTIIGSNSGTLPTYVVTIP